MLAPWGIYWRARLTLLIIVDDDTIDEFFLLMQVALLACLQEALHLVGAQVTALELLELWHQVLICLLVLQLFVRHQTAVPIGLLLLLLLE